MRFSGVGTQAQDCLQCGVSGPQSRFGVIETEEVHVIVSRGQLAVGEVKIRVARDSLFKQADCLTQFFFNLTIESYCREKPFGPDVRTVGRKIFGWSFANGRFLFR